MSSNTLHFTRGVNKKPVSSEALQQALAKERHITGECFFGYPLIATPEGKYFIDCTLISPQKGIVIFDLVEGMDLGDYEGRQDDLANKLEARLKLHRELVKGRTLCIPLTVITYAPAIANIPNAPISDYPLANEHNLPDLLAQITWQNSSEDLYLHALSALESLTSVRKGRSKRDVRKTDSLGAKLKALEDSIATLDHRQNRAVIETVEGVQRIRGLAGSGKTIVLALKAAYLHTQYPEWRIAVTFNTRSLKGQFRRLINNFCIEQSGQEPDWTKIRIVNAWGAPGSDDRDGIYYEFCRTTGHEFLDFRSAARRFGSADSAFDGVCQGALSSKTAPQIYDAILVDEAQDFAPSFLRLCYSLLRPPKRLVYAYDELQNLSGTSLPPPEEIFGTDNNGQPLVSLAGDPRRDVILQKCYRNSRPVLVTAHALGFGIYRKPAEETKIGLVQMFDHPSLWQEIGYRTHKGQLEKGHYVSLERTHETSPDFLESHSSLDELVSFSLFKDETGQNDWLVEQIRRNLEEDELRHDDIIVIHPDPATARSRVGPIRRALYDVDIPSHLAGVDTDADIFFNTESPSITFTGIYRAKGNEAGMVYVINAQECDGKGKGLATLRNRLFTAITRSKAWVRILGYGPKMETLIAEFDELKRRNFRLEFVYPDDEMLSQIRIVHRDLSPHEKMRLEKKKSQASELVDALEKGEIAPEDLDEETRNRLLKLLGGGQ